MFLYISLNMTQKENFWSFFYSHLNSHCHKKNPCRQYFYFKNIFCNIYRYIPDITWFESSPRVLTVFWILNKNASMNCYYAYTKLHMKHKQTFFGQFLHTLSLYKRKTVRRLEKVNKKLLLSLIFNKICIKKVCCPNI